MYSTFSNDILNDFFILGIKDFNSTKFQRTHIVWEKIWKKGNMKDRKKIKGFIQLSGAIINHIRGKKESSDYLFTKSIGNISSNNFRRILDQDKLIDDIKSFYNKGNISITVYKESL